jgi:3-oxoadipate CoA-transferase beta subunit
MDPRTQRDARDIGPSGGYGAMSYSNLTRDEIAKRIAQDIPEGSYVNLGIGMPTLVGNHLPKDREIFLHSENGILGMGPAPAPGEEDADLINAGKEAVTLLTGGAYFHHTDSFAMMRGGHLDIAVLGAFQVSVNGDLANWSTGEPAAIPAVGGAMDLAVGAKNVWVMMEHLTKSGESKIVERCTYPLTGIGVVKRVYTDLAVIEITPRGLVASRLVPGLVFEELQRVTGVPLAPSGALAAA